jgi:hypothetical protein
MPSLSLPNAGTFKRGLTVLSIAIGLALTGCGSETATTRISETEETESSPYLIQVRSPVQFTNVQYRVIKVTNSSDAGVEIAKKVVTDTTDQTTFEIQQTDIPSSTLLLIEISPVSSTSTYFDPILQKTVAFPLTKKLHALVNYNRITSTATYKVDPFSELSYRRTLYRTGQLDNQAVEQPNYKTLYDAGAQTLRYSDDEIESIFIVQPITYGLDFDKISDLKRSNNSRSFIDLLFSIGYIKTYATQFNDQTAPWFGFIDLVESDISDGDLDGMTLAGLGTEGIYFDQLSSSKRLVLEPTVLNTNPEHNTIGIIAAAQSKQRTEFGKVLGTHITTFFDQFFTETNSKSEYDYIHSIKYSEFKTEGNTPLTSRTFGLRSLGAGNYNRAFGLYGDTVSKNALNADINSIATNNNTGIINDIEQLAGRYQNLSSNCTLNISTTGRISLQKGTQSSEKFINHELQDNLFRATKTSTDYILNIGNPSDNSFIQIRLANVNATDKTALRIVSASTGTAPTAQPEQLVTEDFSCTF